jgi:hypothetical protein
MPFRTALFRDARRLALTTVLAAERATDLAHRFAVQQLSDKPQALEHSFHGIRTSPGKGKAVTHVSGTICHLCLGPLTATNPHVGYLVIGTVIARAPLKAVSEVARP